MNAAEMTPEQLAQYYMRRGEAEGGAFGESFQGGASQGGAFGGAPSVGEQPRSQPSDRGMFGRGYIDAGPWGRALQAASFAPGPLGVAAGLANFGIRANNLSVAQDMRAAVGSPSLSFGQIVGGMLGLNDYGTPKGHGVLGNEQYGPLSPNERYSQPSSNEQYGPPSPSEQYGPPSPSEQYGPPSPSESIASTGGDVGGDSQESVGDYGGSGDSGGDYGGAFGGDDYGGDFGGGDYGGDSGGGDYGGSDASDSGVGGGGSERGESRSDHYYANGGYLRPEGGAFVVPADVVSGVGSGSTSAGARHYHKYGGELIEGNGDGRSDDVKAGAFRFSSGEVYIPKDGVKKAGGADKLREHVLKTRKNTVNTLKNLPPPKR